MRKKVREKGDNKKERKALGSDTERVVGKNHREWGEEKKRRYYNEKERDKEIIKLIIEETSARI